MADVAQPSLAFLAQSLVDIHPAEALRLTVSSILSVTLFSIFRGRDIVHVYDNAPSHTISPPPTTCLPTSTSLFNPADDNLAAPVISIALSIVFLLVLCYSSFLQSLFEGHRLSTLAAKNAAFEAIWEYWARQVPSVFLPRDPESTASKVKSLFVAARALAALEQDFPDLEADHALLALLRQEFPSIFGSDQAGVGSSPDIIVNRLQELCSERGRSSAKITKLSQNYLTYRGQYTRLERSVKAFQLNAEHLYDGLDTFEHLYRISEYAGYDSLQRSEAAAFESMPEEELRALCEQEGEDWDIDSDC